MVISNTLIARNKQTFAHSSLKILIDSGQHFFPFLLLSYKTVTVFTGEALSDLNHKALIKVAEFQFRGFFLVIVSKIEIVITGEPFKSPLLLTCSFNIVLSQLESNKKFK